MSKAKKFIEGASDWVYKDAEEKKTSLGKRWANALGLKANKQGFYSTDWGKKTAIGIYEMIKALAKEDK